MKVHKKHSGKGLLKVHHEDRQGVAILGGSGFWEIYRRPSRSRDGPSAQKKGKRNAIERELIEIPKKLPSNLVSQALIIFAVISQA